MKRGFPTSIRNARRGAALMAVLWLIAILGIATMAALRVISFDMQLATSKIHGSRAKQIAEMGIAVGSNPIVKRSDPILRQYNGEAGEGFEVRIQSEGGRFNINSILLQDDKALLRSMFIDWGLDIDQAQAVADVRSAAADAAVAAASAILSKSVKGQVADDLLAKGVSEVRAKLN